MGVTVFNYFIGTLGMSSNLFFLAPTGELYELLCHRKRGRKGRKSTNGPFLE